MGQVKWIIRAALCAALLLGVYCNEERVYKMPDYNIVRQNDGSRFFFPYIVQVPGFIRDVFPVPVKDAVGTINLNNAITIVKFKGDTTPDLDVVAKNFLDEVDGDFDFGFCPVFSDEMIVYTQTRWAVVADVKTGKVQTPVLTMSLDDYIIGIRSLDTASNKFLVVRATPGNNDYDKILHVMQYNDEKFTSLGEIKAGCWANNYDTPWLVHAKKIITYDSTANKLLCHDADLKPSTHPFVEIFNRKSGTFRKLKEMVIHPTLPFGLVVEEGKDLDWKQINAMPLNEETDKIKRALYKQQEIHALYLLRWDTNDTEKQYIPIHTGTFSLLPPLKVKKYGHFSFSPNGDWLVFGHEDLKEDEFGNFIGGKHHPFFIGLPVDEKKPFLFGDPLFLGRTMKPDAEYKTSAWTTDPTAFVAADGFAMYKWDLGRSHLAPVVTSPGKPISLE
jgi:hypothetical protein